MTGTNAPKRFSKEPVIKENRCTQCGGAKFVGFVEKKNCPHCGGTGTEPRSLPELTVGEPYVGGGQHS